MPNDPLRLLQHHISKSVDLKLKELLFVVNCLVNACQGLSIHHRIECHLAAPGDTSIYGQEIRSHGQPPTWSVTTAWELDEEETNRYCKKPVC